MLNWFGLTEESTGPSRTGTAPSCSAATDADGAAHVRLPTEAAGNAILPAEPLQRASMPCGPRMKMPSNLTAMPAAAPARRWRILQTTAAVFGGKGGARGEGEGMEVQRQNSFGVEQVFGRARR